MNPTMGSLGTGRQQSTNLVRFYKEWVQNNFATDHFGAWEGTGSPTGPQSAEARVNVASGDEAGVGTRIATGVDGYGLSLVAGTGVNLYRYDNGSLTTLDTATPPITAGTTYTARLTSDGSAHSGEVNDTEEVTATDSTYTNGAPGLYSFSFGATWWDDFIFDDLTAAAGLDDDESDRRILEVPAIVLAQPVDVMIYAQRKAA